MYPSIHPPIHPPIHRSIDLSIHLSIYLFYSINAWVNIHLGYPNPTPVKFMSQCQVPEQTYQKQKAITSSKQDSRRIYWNGRSVKSTKSTNLSSALQIFRSRWPWNISAQWPNCGWFANLCSQHGTLRAFRIFRCVSRWRRLLKPQHRTLSVELGRRSWFSHCYSGPVEAQIKFLGQHPISQLLYLHLSLWWMYHGCAFFNRFI